MSSVGGVPASQVDLDASVKAFHIANWKDLSDPDRMKMLRRVVAEAARDPRLAFLAVDIVRNAGVQPRDYRNQAAALLKWVQREIYYANEPGERLQDPLLTLKARTGDCDDMAMLYAAFCEALRLPWRFVLSGKNKEGTLVRWIEGTPYKFLNASHIYCVVGWPPFQPTQWAFAEPTLRGVPLGWDVISHKQKHGNAPVVLPELAGVGDTGAASSASILPTYRKEDFDLHPATILRDVLGALTPRKIVGGLIVGAVLTGIVRQVAKRSKKR